MVLDAARRKDAGEVITTEAACCKMFATEMVGRVADRVVQIHGDVRLFRLYEGTTQIQQLVIARNMIGDAA